MDILFILYGMVFFFAFTAIFYAAWETDKPKTTTHKQRMKQIKRK